MNERQSRDSNRSTMNTGPMRTKFCVFRGRYDRHRTLAIRIAAITLASDSAITIARFRPSKLSFLSLFFFEICSFFSLARIPCFSSVFPSFSGFRGSVGIKILVFVVVVLALFKKKQGREGEGYDVKHLVNIFVEDFPTCHESI